MARLRTNNADHQERWLQRLDVDGLRRSGRARRTKRSTSGNHLLAVDARQAPNVIPRANFSDPDLPTGAFVQGRIRTSEECIHAAADMAVELDIAGIDIEDRLLKSYDPNYLQELAHQVEGLGVRFGYCGLIVDFSAPISSIEDEIVRAKALIDATQYLGIKSIRLPSNGVVAGQTMESTSTAV